MLPNEKTIYVGRVADQLSSTGSHIYNTLYGELNQNALYLQFASADSREFITGMRALRFRGCTVVGSHSRNLPGLLDDLDPHAREVGAVNTVVNEDGFWKGYKTDGPALLDVLSEAAALSGRRIVVLGAGKLVRELAIVLRHSRVSQVQVYNRDEEKGAALCREVGFQFMGGPSELSRADGDIFINATDVGALWCETKDVFPEEMVKRFDVVMDVTFKPTRTALGDKAVALGKTFVPGWRMFAYQGFRQVKLYLGVEPSINRLCELILQEFS